jgi:hypothetical protein
VKKTRKINEQQMRKIIREVINEAFDGSYNGSVDLLEQTVKLSHQIIGAVNRWEMERRTGMGRPKLDTTMANLMNFALDMNSKAKKLISDFESVT